MPRSNLLRSLPSPGLLAPAALAVACALPAPARAHGAPGGDELTPGEFQLSPVITLEGHAGLENNLEEKPRHYAIDGLIGVVMEWGLPNRGSFAIEAMVGPTLAWGEAEHFYGRVHADHHDHHGHENHEHHEHHDHGGAPFRRADIKGQLQARYAPNDRLSFMAEWKPYSVTRNQGEDSKGLNNEVNVGVVIAFGDGDVNFALGDGLESIADGLFLSVENRTGWQSDGTYIGNYTDPWVGLEFNIDKLNVTLSAGPRFYSPGSYSGLPFRTDWGGELTFELPVSRAAGQSRCRSVEVPVSRGAVLLAHWKPIYSSQDGEGWGRGWQHHIGTGVTFRF